MSRKGKSRSKGKLDYGGLDPGLVQSILGSIAPNPATGKVELHDIMKHMSKNPSQMDNLMAQMDTLGIGQSTEALESYDFSSLAKTIKDQSFWVVQLENMGFVDSSGSPVDPEKASTIPGISPTFVVYCYDEKGRFRVTQECTGLPESKTILQAIRCAIAKPVPPLKPCLPSFLMLSIKLKAHVPNLRPFLDSLPAPFKWRIETPEEAQTVHDGVDQLNRRSARSAIEHVEVQMKVGDDAFAKKDRARALAAYDEAIDHVIDVLSQNATEEEEREAKRQLAKCYSSHAAALLLEGGPKV